MLCSAPGSGSSNPNKSRKKTCTDDSDHNDDNDARSLSHYMALMTKKQMIDLFHGAGVQDHEACVYQLKCDARLVTNVLDEEVHDRYGISLYVFHTVSLGLCLSNKCCMEQVPRQFEAYPAATS